MKKLFVLLLLLTSCTILPSTPQTPVTPAPLPQPKAAPAPDLTALIQAAQNSACASYNWKSRGRAPKAYIAGMAISFAKSICHPERPDVKLISQARFQPESTYDKTDALSWYNSNFAQAGMSNDVAGNDVIRHVYDLLLGLGMRESSGQFCCGRDMSASFSSADAAEAGTFQASWGSRNAAPSILVPLFNKYQASDAGCYKDIWSSGVSCSANDAINWGTGTGHDWQALTKNCPTFGDEYAAVLIRKSGGTKGEFGPLRRKEAELKVECDLMFQAVERLVDNDPNYCKSL